MYVFDIEGDGLLDTITKIHCIVYTSDGKNFTSLTSYPEMKKFLETEEVKVIHNGIRYDLRAVEKILGIKVKGKIYDTLAMSWVFEPNRPKHGLESWGETFGVPKPEIDNWDDLPLEEYVHRCTEDVKINWKVWVHLIDRAKRIYQDRENLDRFLQYLSFKMECAAKAEDSTWKVDLDLVTQSIEELEKQEQEKVEELRMHMPMAKVYATRKFPKSPFKKDGTLSAQGIKWKAILKENNLPSNHREDIKVIKELVPANPGSSDQVKEWLFSLGWEPCTFDYKKNDDGSDRLVPQVRKDGELTPSVRRLIDEHPGVEVLDGLTVIRHRLVIFRNFLKFQVNGYLKAEIDGLTNTLRFKHRNPLVNLPGVDKPWGKEIRGSLIADEGEVLCGADMVSLEDSTRKHYVKPLDPILIEEQSQVGYDSHLKIAVEAGMITNEEYEFYKWYKESNG